MRIPEIEAALKELRGRQDELERVIDRAAENIAELRNQLGVERAPVAASTEYPEGVKLRNS